MSIDVKPSTDVSALPVYTWVSPVDGKHTPAYMTWEHSRIHDGHSYDASVLLGRGSELADAASLNVLVQCNTGMHFIFDVSCGGNAEVYMFNSPTFSAAGTAINSFNKSDYSTNTTDNVLTHSPTLTDDGAQRMSKLLPGGIKAAGSGGSDGSYNREINLKAGNDYLIRVTNISGAIQPVSMSMEWYEL